MATAVHHQMQAVALKGECLRFDWEVGTCRRLPYFVDSLVSLIERLAAGKDFVGYEWQDVVCFNFPKQKELPSSQAKLSR